MKGEVKVSAPKGQATNYVNGILQFLDNLYKLEEIGEYENKWEMMTSIAEVKKSVESLQEAYKYRA